MYAFAVWDPEAATLLLARDPFGKKPLLYFRAGDELVFASELEALAAHPAFDPAIDPAALGQYLLYKYVPGDATLLAGVRELPPGHWHAGRPGGSTIARHYRPPARGRCRPAGCPGARAPSPPSAPSSPRRCGCACARTCRSARSCRAASTARRSSR